jgi:hypothetical protein
MIYFPSHLSWLSDESCCETTLPQPSLSCVSLSAGAVSSDQCYLAALVDEGYLGIFSFHELCSSAAFRSGKPVESLDVIISGTKSHCIGAAPIFKIPVHATTRSGIKSSCGGSRISSPDSLRDMCWSPSHVSGGRLLALAGLNSVSIWEVPKGRAKGPRLQNGCIKYKDKDETMVLKPTLLHSCAIVFPGILTPLNSAYGSNVSVEMPSHLRTIDSDSSTGNFKSQFGSQAQAPSIKSIEWHMSAVPSLIAFSTTCDPIRIILPRSDAELEVTRVLCSSSDSLTQVEGSEDVDRPPSSRSATQTAGPKNAAPRVHPFGGASLKSDIVIAVDSTGSLTVLAGPVSDGSKTQESSCSLMSLKNKQVRAVCLSGDDSIVCIAYSLSSKTSSTASVQTSRKDMLSIESLQEAISASQHGSRSRSSTGFQHALAGISLRDAIYVPDRIHSGPILLSVEASSYTPVCISAAVSRAHSSPSHQDACAAISQSEDPEAEGTPTVCVRSDSSFVSVMDSLLCIGDDRQHRMGVIEQSAGGRAAKAPSRSSFLNPSTQEVFVAESNAKHLPLNTVSRSTISSSGGGCNVLPVSESVGEVEVKWLREPGAVYGSSDRDTRTGDGAHSSDEKNQNEKANKAVETVMRVPITDPLLAQPDLLFYRERTQLPLSECSSSLLAVTALAVADSSSLLMGYLAVGSTQSSRVLVYALKGSLSGYSATIHHAFDLPKDQVNRIPSNHIQNTS